MAFSFGFSRPPSTDFKARHEIGPKSTLDVLEPNPSGLVLARGHLTGSCKPYGAVKPRPFSRSVSFAFARSYFTVSEISAESSAASSAFSFRYSVYSGV